MGGVSVAVAQAMRYAGCPNRRSLGVREVFPRTHAVPAELLSNVVDDILRALPLPPPAALRPPATASCSRLRLPRRSLRPSRLRSALAACRCRSPRSAISLILAALRLRPSSSSRTASATRASASGSALLRPPAPSSPLLSLSWSDSDMFSTSAALTSPAIARRTSTCTPTFSRLRFTSRSRFRPSFRRFRRTSSRSLSTACRRRSFTTSSSTRSRRRLYPSRTRHGLSSSRSSVTVAPSSRACSAVTASLSSLSFTSRLCCQLLQPALFLGNLHF